MLKELKVQLELFEVLREHAAPSPGPDICTLPLVLVLPMFAYVLPMFWMPNCIWITHAASVAAAAARGRSRCVAAELAGPHVGAAAASA